MINGEQSSRKRRKLANEGYKIDKLEEVEFLEQDSHDFAREETADDLSEEALPSKGDEFSSSLKPIMKVISRLREQFKATDKQYIPITKQIERHYENTRPSSDEISLKRYFRDFMGDTVVGSFPRLTMKLRLYGSSACGLDSRGDDIDLGVEFLGENKPTDQETLQVIARKLREATCHTIDGKPYKLFVNPILHAKVPIVKIEDPAQGVKCDISNWREQGGVSNLFAMYCAIDDRVAKLLVYIKYWSKRRGINDGRAMKLTSFSYALLGIKYLQLVEVIPVLSSEKKVTWKSKNRANLGQLLLGFFEFWAKFNYEKLEISILTESIEPKDCSKFDVRENQTWIIIADPIERRNNVARNIRAKTLLEFKNELTRGIRYCKGTKHEDLVKVRLVKGWKSNRLAMEPEVQSIFMGPQLNGARYVGDWNKSGKHFGRRWNKGGGWKRRRSTDW